MTRIGAMLCKLRHRFDRVDDCGRVFCSRQGCEARKPVRFAPIQAPELEGRQLTRPRTRGEKL